jgi:hypothetical protein
MSAVSQRWVGRGNLPGAKAIVSIRRISKAVVRERTARTGETHQQAQIALSKQVPVHHFAPPATDRPCIGRCISEFSQADRDGYDGGSMVACARCPGSVCVECGRAPVEEPFARCEQCAETIGKYERTERLRRRCAGRRCISQDLARTSDSNSAVYTCDSCHGPICFCERQPVENVGDWCDTGCDSDYDDADYDYHYDDDGFDIRNPHEELREQVRYAVGLIVKLGGGTYRQVFARLYRAMGARLADASIDQLHAGLQHARDWEQQLRHKVGRASQ